MGRFLAVSMVAILALGLAGCFGSKRDIAEIMDRAKSYIAEGNMAKAAVELQQALKVAPANPQANLALAKIEDARGDLNAAVPHYVFAATPEARLIEPQLRVIEILMDSGRLQEAAGRMNATLGSFPTDPDALALRADLQERQGETDAARTNAQAALTRNGSLSRAVSVLAMVQLRQGNAQEAIKIVEAGLRKDPDNLRLLQVQSAALLAVNQPEKAVAALQSIVRSAPRSVLAQSALADLEAVNGRAADALTNFKAAVNADPANQPMQLAFIEFLKRHGPPGTLDTYLNKLISENAESGTYDLVLAEYDRSEGRIGQSESVLSRARDRLKDSSEGLAIKVALAKVFSTQNRNGAAVAMLDDVLRTEPDNADALMFRAVLQLENGRGAAAVADALLVLRRNPVNSGAFQVLATAYMDQGQPALAIEAMKRSTALAPANDDAQIRLAAFLQNGGAAESARDVMARLTLRQPDAPAVWDADILLALERKDWGTANRSLARYRNLTGGGQEANVLDGRIKAAQGQSVPALQAFRSALESDSNINADVIGLYARAAVTAKQMDPAADYLQGRAGALKPEAAQAAWLAIMTLRGDAGSLDKVAAAYKEAVRAAPSTVEPYQIYTAVLMGQKRTEDARKVVEAGLRAGASAWSMAVLTGYIEEAAGNLPAAALAYKKALTDNPLSLSAANNYANLVGDLYPRDINMLTEARKNLAGQEDSMSAPLVDTIAWLDYRLGRFEEAKSLLTRIKAGESDNPQMRFHMAAALLALGDRTSGLALLDTVKGLNFPGSNEVRDLSAT